MTSPFSRPISRRIYYVVDKMMGIYYTPATDNIPIRVHYVPTPTPMSDVITTLPIDDDFKDAVTYGAALRLVKLLMPKNPKKFMVLESGLKIDYEEKKAEVLAAGDNLAGDDHARVGFRDY